MWHLVEVHGVGQVNGALTRIADDAVQSITEHVEIGVRIHFVLRKRICS